MLVMCGSQTRKDEEREQQEEVGGSSWYGAPRVKDKGQEGFAGECQPQHCSEPVSQAYLWETL